VEFSASHICRLPELSSEDNHRLYGPEASPHGHGHNYILEVTVEGEPDQVTGMVIDLKTLKDVLDEQIVSVMDHRFLNAEVKPFDTMVPTTENIARLIWQRLEPILETPETTLAKVRLFQTSDLYVDITREAA
jgi:6-pyruvoyltetrahydropterin/6-carboxytetrahydropterin synthase